VRSTAPISVLPVREPSRYLLALLKFEPDRQAVLDLMFRETNDDEIMTELPLVQVLEPLIKMAGSHRKRYTYKTVEPTQQNCCSDCNKSPMRYVRRSFIPDSTKTYQTSSRPGSQSFARVRSTPSLQVRTCKARYEIAIGPTTAYPSCRNNHALNLGAQNSP
jgi:hypothetical protein